MTSGRGGAFVETIFVGGVSTPLHAMPLLYLIEMIKKNLFKKYLIGEGMVKFLSPLFNKKYPFLLISDAANILSKALLAAGAVQYCNTVAYSSWKLKAADNYKGKVRMPLVIHQLITKVIF